MKNKSVTIKEIARQLGISVSTVSRALHDAYDVNQDTRKKVLALAEQLEYKPNPFAISLVKQQTRIIGVLLPEIATHYFSTVVKGIQDVAYHVGYNVMFFISDESYEREKTIVKNLSANMLDGLLISVSIETTNGDHLKKLTDQGLPLVFFDRYLPDLPVSRVIQDDYKGAYHVTMHLVQQGYQRIAHLAGPKHMEMANRRMQGYIDALRDARIPIRKEYILHSGFTHEDGIRDVSKLLAVRPMPEAIFAVNDRKAIGAMMTLKKSGYLLPDDMGLAGFTNALISEAVEPGLTTIEQSAYQIGTTSCQLLLDRIKTPDQPPQTIVMPGNLIIRDSSKKKIVKIQ
ncbi:MAG TPA: LacI family DNA-binding transcriptional regulator [Saprospiraceae bacterium]|nr:LacI family DNA-binding transcriptional regulator [Saprospiraceae bacterium]